MTESLTDLYAGAGGSCQGAAAVAGLEIVIAANHWPVAVASHQANFPGVDHDCADISQVDPRRYPRTSILWASPECTNHTNAKGRRRAPAQPGLFGDEAGDAGAERSRATMWDVCRFAEHHRYRAVVVENVVEAVRWVMWPAWLHAMRTLGYRHQIVYLNSMHAPAGRTRRAPQSRDRKYTVFTRDGAPVPDLAVRPPAWCPECGREVAAVQSWKRPDAPWGRYRAQYVFRCPNQECRHRVVEPYADPAAAAIDWSLPGRVIGERERPLSPKTLARIRAGLTRYATPPTTPTDRTPAAGAGALVVPVEGRDGKQCSPVERPLRTLSTRAETGLVVPYYGSTVAAQPVGRPLPTLAAVDTCGVAFVAELRGGRSDARPVTQPLATVTASGNHHGLVRHPADPGSPVGGWSGVPAVEECSFRMLEPREIAAGMAFGPDYVLTGTRRNRVRQLGNAVTPPAAEWLLSAVVESLNGTGAGAGR